MTQLDLFPYDYDSETRWVLGCIRKDTGKPGTYRTERFYDYKRIVALCAERDRNGEKKDGTSLRNRPLGRYVNRKLIPLP